MERGSKGGLNRTSKIRLPTIYYLFAAKDQGLMDQELKGPGIDGAVTVMNFEHPGKTMLKTFSIGKYHRQ